MVHRQAATVSRLIGDAVVIAAGVDALALFIAVKLCLRGGGIGVDLPIAARGKVFAAVLDEPDDIRQRVAQKNADLMREISLAAEPFGQLVQQLVCGAGV